MNQDIAYSVLAFLDNPKQYSAVSRSFHSGAQVAQREYAQYVKRSYPLLTMSPEDLISRLLPNREGERYTVLLGKWQMIEIMLNNLIIFYLNKMALNKQWGLFQTALTLIDKSVLIWLGTPIIDILHINDNDELAASLVAKWSKRGPVVSHAQRQYYEFKPTEEAIRNFRVSDDTIGYIPKEVIDYYDRHEEAWNDLKSSREDILPAIMRRRFLPGEKPGEVLTRGMGMIHSNDTWNKIIGQVRDYPFDTVDELITRLPIGDVYIDNLRGVYPGGVYDKTVPFNRRILKYVKDAIVLHEREYYNICEQYYSSPLVISYLLNLWLDDSEMLRRTNIKAEISCEMREIRMMPNYIAVKQAQGIPINIDELLDSFADISPIER